jgi:hypothetical protein
LFTGADQLTTWTGKERVVVVGSYYVRWLDLIVFGVATFAFVYLVVGITGGKG